MMAARADTVVYARVERIATLTLNRPERLNSLDLPSVSHLIAGARRAVAEGAAVLVVTGRGRAFCAGADFSSALDHRDADGAIDLGRAMRSHYNPLVETLTQLPIPVVMAVNGIATGGGASLALCGDLVIAAHSASFRQIFIDIGLVPDMGATWLVPRLAGRARARGMALLGDEIPATLARDWGLIWDVVDDDALMPEALRIAARLSDKPPRALRSARRALDLSCRYELMDQLTIEARMQAEFGRLPEFSEAVRRFATRKNPAKSRRND